MTNILGLVIFILLLMGTFWAFDTIVHLEYLYHRSAWDQDGRPDGFFWKPAEFGHIYLANTINSWARHRCVIVWLFSTPEWAQDDVKATLFVWRFRILVLTWVAVMIFALWRFGTW